MLAGKVLRSHEGLSPRSTVSKQELCSCSAARVTCTDIQASPSSRTIVYKGCAR